MVKASAVPEVGSIDGKLVVGVKLSFHGVIAGPWITGATFQDEHPVIDGRTVEWTEGINFGRRRIWTKLSEGNGCCVSKHEPLFGSPVKIMYHLSSMLWSSGALWNVSQRR